MNLNNNQLLHLKARAGFGEISLERSKSRSGELSSLFRQSKKPLVYINNPLKGGQEVKNFRLLAMMLKSKGQLKELNVQWVKRMTQQSFVEKMTMFWHDHFATRSVFAYLMQVQNNTLREHALGSFRTLLHAISKDPVMLLFLNNHQNKKLRPNENFAREVMELFTLGEGNYTETDIKEAARAFTGWAVSRKGKYELNERHHDSGLKTFRGKTGNFSGEDIIDMLLEDRQTATYIAGKIYRFFVNERINHQHVRQMSKRFYESDYDIADLMRFVFESSWFYEQENVGVKIKSPIELLAGYQSTLGFSFDSNKLYLQLQHKMGQLLFFPPNVAGWSGGRSWIDGQSLLYRMQIPQFIFGIQDLSITPPAQYGREGLFQLSRVNNRQVERLRANVNWKNYIKQFNNVKEVDLLETIVQQLIRVPLDKFDWRFIDEFTDKSTREQYIKSLTIHAMSLPEYQMT